MTDLTQENILTGGNEIQTETTPVSPHKTSLCNKISTLNEYSSDKIILNIIKVYQVVKIHVF
jgi:hypothetical protein